MLFQFFSRSRTFSDFTFFKKSRTRSSADSEQLLLAEMAGVYNHSLAEFLRIVQGDVIGAAAAKSTVAAIQEEIILKASEVKPHFSKYFDQCLLDKRKKEEITLREFERTYLQFFAALFHAKEASRICQSEDERKDAYKDAVSKFFYRVGKDGFQYKHSARAFFFRIYLDECKNALGRIKKIEKTFSRGAEELILDQLSPAARRKLTVPPIDLLEYDVQLLRAKNIYCFDLIYQKIGLGYSYKELAGRFGKTVAQLKDDLYRCKGKLLKEYLHLNKSTK